MMPKTKLHHEILRLHKKLPGISDTQFEWGRNNLFKPLVWKTKHKAVCFECGHAWQLETNLISTLFPVECPSCGKKLELNEGKSWTRTDVDYLEIVTVIGDFQVIRIIQFYKFCRKTMPVYHSSHEICQHWIKKDGHLEIMSIGFSSMGQWCRGGGWGWGGPMELRSTIHDRYFVPCASYPRKRIHPYMTRNGFEGETYGYTFGWLARHLLTDSKFETILKAGQVNFIENYSQFNINRYWPQIKICIRNNYIVKDTASWYDHLGLLIYFKKDIFNSKYICPENFNKEHKKLIDKKRRIDKKREDEVARQRRIEDEKLREKNAGFRRAKKKLIGLVFAEGEITITPMIYAQDFKDEEKALDHCTYSSRYNKKDLSIVLSAKVCGVRTETIEIDIRAFRILQCRGYNNLDSPFHKDIMALMQKSLGKLKEAFDKAMKPVKKMKVAA